MLLIVGLTYFQFRMTDRTLMSPLGSGSNVTAEQRAELLKRVPKDFGNWRGQDRPVEEQVKETAGAVGAVSRVYRNIRTNEVVDLWLIVGHGRPISAHTPDICYRSSGFGARSRKNAPFKIYMEDETEVPFLTNMFYREDVTGRRLIRVLWTWYNTETHAGKVVWEAPDNARWYFGNTRALYKMYFTSEMRDPMETPEQSPCLQFAEEFLPEVNKALTLVHSGSPPSGKTAADAAPAEEADTKADLETTDLEAEPETGDGTQESAIEEADEPAVEPSETIETTEAASGNLDDLLESASEPATTPEPEATKNATP
jgi:hypothetical protein